MTNLHLLLCILLLSCGLFVVFSTSPIESVLFLILAFCIAGIILFLFNLDFFGIMFIIIYVGAIAVLFLFVVMMLNIKLQYNFLDRFTFRNILYVLIVLFLLYVIFLNLYSQIFIEIPFLFNSDLLYSHTIIEKDIFDHLNNIKVFGQVLYNYFSLYVPLAGFILLIALVGVIVLTLHFNKFRNKELDFRQLSRSDNFIVFFNKSN